MLGGECMWKMLGWNFKYEYLNIMIYDFFFVVGEGIFKDWSDMVSCRLYYRVY